MPHLVILYSPNLELKADFTALCRAMANAMLAVRDEAGAQVFPNGGTRVFAFPAAHYAVADDSPPAGKDYGFIWLNLRMAKGRSPEVHKRAGEAVSNTAKTQLGHLITNGLVGITTQVDEGQEVYDNKFSSLHSFFQNGKQ